MFNLSKELDYTLENSQIYNLVTEKVIIPISRTEVAKNLPNIINDSFKIYDPSKGNVDFNNIGKADIICFVFRNYGYLSSFYRDNFTFCHIVQFIIQPA